MEVKNLKDLTKIIQLCKKKGIKHLKLGALELEFDIEAIRPKDKVLHTQANTPQVDELSQLTPEQILNWSTNNLEA